MQLLPAIDLRDGKCVRLRQGDYDQETIFGDDPAAMAARWESEGASRLHLVDLDGAKAGRPVNLEAVSAIVERVNIPCQLGGGIRDEAAIKTVLNDVGVDRVIVGTQALKHPDWFREMAAQYPAKLVLGVDARDGMIATEGWLEVSETSAIDLTRQYEGLDLAAVIYTNIANDGMMAGIDAGTLNDLAALSDIGFSVIASGGVTTMKDIDALLEISADHPNLNAAIIGRAIYEGTIQLPEAIAAVQKAGK